MPAYTPLGIPYEEDYADPADFPAADQAQAVAVDALITERAYAARSVNAGAGLTGGGNLTTDRTINVGAGWGITVDADTVAVDELDLNTAYARSGRILTAGAGLTGGGALTVDRTFNVVGGNGITVTADAVAVDYAAFDGRYAQVYVQATQPPAGNIGDIWCPV